LSPQYWRGTQLIVSLVNRGHLLSLTTHALCNAGALGSILSSGYFESSSFSCAANRTAGVDLQVIPHDTLSLALSQLALFPHEVHEPTRLVAVCSLERLLSSMRLAFGVQTGNMGFMFMPVLKPVWTTNIL